MWRGGCRMKGSGDESQGLEKQREEQQERRRRDEGKRLLLQPWGGKRSYFVSIIYILEVEWPHLQNKRSAVAVVILSCHILKLKRRKKKKISLIGDHKRTLQKTDEMDRCALTILNNPFQPSTYSARSFFTASACRYLAMCCGGEGKGNLVMGRNHFHLRK